MKVCKRRTTFFRARGLILDVNSSSTGFDKHLRQLHDGGESSVSGVGIRDDRSEVVDSGGGRSLGVSEVGSRYSLLSVVEE